MPRYPLMGGNGNNELLLAAQERLRKKPRPSRVGLGKSSFARPPQPKLPGSGFKRQQSY